jgi:hypothetical protein
LITASRHLGTLNGVPEVGGVVADYGHVLVADRRAAGLVWIDARTLETRANWVLPSNRLGLSALPLGIWVGCLSQLSVNQRISPTKIEKISLA